MATLDIPATVNGFGLSTTLVGGPTCISTNDGGATYMQQHVVAAGGVTSGFNDTINFPATPIDGDVISTSLATVTKGNDPRSFGLPGNAAAFFLNSGAPAFTTWFWQTVFADGATDWTELITPLQKLGVDVVGKTQIEAGTVQYNPGYALLNCSVSGPIDITLQWTYIALRVEYTPAQHAAPPCQIYPRDDDQGVGSAAIWPPPSSGRPGSYY